MSSNEIDKNNITLDQNVVVDHNENLQHNNIAGVPDDVIAGVQDDDDPRLGIREYGILNDDLVGVPIAGVNDEQQQELENNENAIQKFNNNNYISDDEGSGKNQPDNYVSDDAQTKNEPDALNTNEDEVDTGITDNTEYENANKDESKDDDDDDDNNHQPPTRWTAPKQKKEQRKIKGKRAIPFRK